MKFERLRQSSENQWLTLIVAAIIYTFAHGLMDRRGLRHEKLPMTQHRSTSVKDLPYTQKVFISTNFAG